MKKIVLGTFIIFTLSCNWSSPKMMTGLEGKKIPEFNFYRIDSSILNTKDISLGKPFLLFYLQPWCPYCQAETKSILKNIKSFENINLYFITRSQSKLLKEYCDKFELSKFSNVIACNDPTSTEKTYFNAPGVPFVAIYGKDKRLVQVLLGESDATQILDLMNK